MSLNTAGESDEEFGTTIVEDNSVDSNQPLSNTQLVKKPLKSYTSSVIEHDTTENSDKSFPGELALKKADAQPTPDNTSTNAEQEKDYGEEYEEENEEDPSDIFNKKLLLWAGRLELEAFNLKENVATQLSTILNQSHTVIQDASFQLKKGISQSTKINDQLNDFAEKKLFKRTDDLVKSINAISRKISTATTGLYNKTQSEYPAQIDKLTSDCTEIKTILTKLSAEQKQLQKGNSKLSNSIVKLEKSCDKISNELTSQTFQGKKTTTSNAVNKELSATKNLVNDSMKQIKAFQKKSEAKLLRLESSVDTINSILVLSNEPALHANKSVNEDAKEKERHDSQDKVNKDIADIKEFLQLLCAKVITIEQHVLSIDQAQKHLGKVAVSKQGISEENNLQHKPVDYSHDNNETKYDQSKNGAMTLYKKGSPQVATPLYTQGSSDKSADKDASAEVQPYSLITFNDNSDDDFGDFSYSHLPKRKRHKFHDSNTFSSEI